MFQAYVAVGFAKNANSVKANPYTMVVRDGNIYLKEITKEEASGLVFYMLDEMSIDEIYSFKDSITVVGVDDVIKLRKNSTKR